MYTPVKIEAVYPDGSIAVRNAFVMENAACRGEDPKMPRAKLIEIATITMQRWNEAYGNHTKAKLRVAK